MAVRVGQRVKLCMAGSLRSHPVNGAIAVVRSIDGESAHVEFTPVVRASGGHEYATLWVGLKTLVSLHPRMPISPIFLQGANDATV